MNVNEKKNTRANKSFSMLIVKYNKYRTCNIPYIDRLLILILSPTVYPFSPSEKELKQDNDLISL